MNQESVGQVMHLDEKPRSTRVGAHLLPTVQRVAERVHILIADVLQLVTQHGSSLSARHGRVEANEGAMVQILPQPTEPDVLKPQFYVRQGGKLLPRAVGIPQGGGPPNQSGPRLTPVSDRE